MENNNKPWVAYLLHRLESMQRGCGGKVETANDANVLLADVLDSIALVEFLAGVAGDCGVTMAAIEDCVGQRFGTVSELAEALTMAGLKPTAKSALAADHEERRRFLPEGHVPVAKTHPSVRHCETTAWLGPIAVKLPATIQPAAALNAAIGRPLNWLESHSGIESRRVWGNEDPLEAAAAAGMDCLRRAGLRPEDVGVLLVTSEASPMLIGLAGHLHHRLHLAAQVPALEIGGACTGFLAALLVGRSMLPQVRVVLLIAVEAPTAVLRLAPGPGGEAAALFGDAAAAALLSSKPCHEQSLGLIDVFLRTDGSAHGLLQAVYEPGREVTVRFQGVPLAERAIRAMAGAIKELAANWRFALGDVGAIVAHGGNGRMVALLARHLGMPLARVWSETCTVGNLGSVSLPAAWAAHRVGNEGPIIWTAAGAGLCWGAALTRR